MFGRKNKRIKELQEIIEDLKDEKMEADDKIGELRADKNDLRAEYKQLKKEFNEALKKDIAFIKAIEAWCEGERTEVI